MIALCSQLGSSGTHTIDRVPAFEKALYVMEVYPDDMVSSAASIERRRRTEDIKLGCAAHPHQTPNG